MSPSSPKIRNSAKALIIENEAILLQRCQIAECVVHLLPGGTQEPGESFADTVRREVLEETGMHVHVGSLVWVREFIAHNHASVADDGTHVVECIFRCTPEAGAMIGTASLPDTGQIDVRWIPLADLASITMWPQTVQQFLITDPDRASTPTPAYLGDCP